MARGRKGERQEEGETETETHTSLPSPSMNRKDLCPSPLEHLRILYRSLYRWKDPEFGGDVDGEVFVEDVDWDGMG
jgi:hypothetical protein